MKVGDLEKFGIPVRIIRLWKERQGETLLPVQQKAIRKQLLGQSGTAKERKETRMIISAPTSSGKSFCAEMAAIRSLTERRKVVMLFPLKSLAEQQYQLFEEHYRPLGIRPLIVTGDHPENDISFATGDYHIAICIYEKFDLFLTVSLDLLKTIGLIVVDEIQTIAEPGRGAILERLLTKIKSSVYNPSMIGLSAVIGDDRSSAGQLAAWLEATLVEERIRPVELIRGVAAEGTFKYRSFNDGDDGEEPFASAGAAENQFDLFVSQIKESSGSTLVFLKSRQETVDAAFRLAGSVNWPEAKDAIGRLDKEEPSFLVRSLRQALSRGVAFHNADLTSSQRSLVEQAFVNKEVKVLFSTTTLAMGVNLAADNVYLETVKYSSGTYSGKPSLVPVSRSEFDNMTGRAGRLQKSKTELIGKAVVLAESEFDRDILWNNYIASEDAGTIDSVFHTQPLEDWLLNMATAGLITEKSETAATALFAGTFCALSETADLSGQFQAAFELLEASGMIVADDGSGGFTVSSLGLAVAKSGLSLTEAVYYRKLVQHALPGSEFGWLALVLSGSGWQLPPSILSRYEQVNNIPMRMCYREYEHCIDDISPLIDEKKRREPLKYRQAASLKALLLLEQWRTLVPVQKLEERFQMHLGQIIHLGETTAHLLYAVGEILGAVDRDTPVKKHLAEIAFTIRHGLPVEYGGIHKYFGGILNRADYNRLEKAGIVTVDDFCQLEEQTQRLLFTGGDKLKIINEKIAQVKEEVQMEPRRSNTHLSDVPVAPILFAEPEMIEIDGSYERERYLVKINGFPVRLTGKSFKYFTKLAWSRLKGESGWIYKEEIEQGFNQARYLYRMKGEIGSGLNSNWSIIENNRLGYYRLDVEPSKIKINMDNLRNHPDYEVRALVEADQLN